MTTNIYILKLEGGRYYVGKSNNVHKRYQEHVNGSGSVWTKKYKPISLEKVIPNASHFDEDKYTKEFMSIHGINKVRGGSYSSLLLDELQEESLKRELRGATDACQTCGRKGHFAKNCYAKTDIEGNDLDEESEEEEDIWCCEHCDKEFTDPDACERHERSCKKKSKPIKKGACFRCGRFGHFADDCYASKDVDGNSIESDDDF